MDQAIRSFNLKTLIRRGDHAVQTKSKWKTIWAYVTDWRVWKAVFEDQAHTTRELGKKYPWFPIMYNWLIVVLIVALFASFGIWGINIHTEKTAVAYAEAVAEQKDAEHRA